MSEKIIRYSVRISGIVQGVGFRPFIYRLATERMLGGWVLNDAQGVLLEIEGPRHDLDSLISAIHSELPSLASISRFEKQEIPAKLSTGFFIEKSLHGALPTVQISPDTFVCQDCLDELFDPHDRRYAYPFINCTNCGPRYSIVIGVPYDRPLTTMVDFPLCAACQKEYDDPASRRFHAQPNACPACGPALSLHDADGLQIEETDPVAFAVRRLQRGEILAVKGLGGFHLVVDPQNEAAVERLRGRKHRDEKPFALMVPDLESAAAIARMSSLERRLLESTERPIVLLAQRRDQKTIRANVAPRNRYFALMLPYTPLQHLLMRAFPALIMTSGNQSDEPIVYTDNEAFARLHGIADVFLCHNRRIHTRTDDSILRELCGQPLMLRRSRGYVPRAVKLTQEQPAVLALGAELKNTICLTNGDRATLSQHIGDLKNQYVLDSLQQATEQLQKLLATRPQIIAHDLHPDYLSTAAALRIADVPKIAIQHHHAHLASCLADNGREEKALGVIFDGIGYGRDGRIWGGEFLLGDYYGFERMGHLAELAMPGGDAATKEPWRMALSLLHFTFGENLPQLETLNSIPPNDRKLLVQMLQKSLNSPPTSSCGRLFDAVSALVGLRQKVSYEGQAALELEMSLDGSAPAEPYVFDLVTSEGKVVADPKPMVRALVDDLQQGRGAAYVSARFHDGLAAMILAVCLQICRKAGPLPVALSGGVFQNAYLTEKTCQLLRSAGFEVLCHRQIPPNDGGISLGQAVIAGRSGLVKSL